MCWKSFAVFVAVAFAPRVASQCSTGYENKVNSGTTLCSQGANSCTAGNCCQQITGTCNAAGVVCTGGKVRDHSKHYLPAGSTATEKQNNCCITGSYCATASSSCDANQYLDPSKATILVASGADKKAACCIARATCADVTCPAGQELIANPSNQKCLTGVTSCGLGTCCTNTATKCKAQASNICNSGYFKDSSKDGAIAGDATAAKTNCCTQQATCADVTCAVGQELMANPSSQKCQTGVSSCNKGTCCKNTAGKCKAQPSSVCDSGFFKDSSKDGNIAGDATAAKTTCCTQKATCAAFWALADNPTASGALKETPLSVAVVGATAAIISLM